MIDRRKNVRHKLQADIEICSDNNVQCVVTSENCSLGGLVIICPEQLIRQISPRGVFFEVGSLAKVTLRFDILNETFDNLRGEILIIRRLSQQNYAVHIAFVDLDLDDETRMEKTLKNVKT